MDGASTSMMIGVLQLVVGVGFTLWWERFTRSCGRSSKLFSLSNESSIKEKMLSVQNSAKIRACVRAVAYIRELSSQVYCESSMLHARSILARS